MIKFIYSEKATKFCEIYELYSCVQNSIENPNSKIFWILKNFGTLLAKLFTEPS